MSLTSCSVSNKILNQPYFNKLSESFSTWEKLRKKYNSTYAFKISYFGPWGTSTTKEVRVKNNKATDVFSTFRGVNRKLHYTHKKVSPKDHISIIGEYYNKCRLALLEVDPLTHEYNLQFTSNNLLRFCGVTEKKPKPCPSEMPCGIVEYIYIKEIKFNKGLTSPST